jgi:uncharacterized protein (DUF2252 family)
MGAQHLSPFLGERTVVARLNSHQVVIRELRPQDVNVRSAWRKDLKTSRAKNLNAPSWLWKSTAELVGLHEASYLEHCRKFALSEAVEY